MANRLTMAQINAIVTLHQSEHSQREIARLLGVQRETVGKYVASGEAQNRPNAPPGSEGTGGAGPPPTGSGPPSDCEPFRELILAKLDQGLSAVRIHQDLRGEPGFTASYYSVRRFVGRLKKRSELPFRRLETRPGEEAQVDFGGGAPIHTAEGKRRRPWIFRIVLSYSRKAYSEAVYRQSTESFMGCLENAFRYFGGVPKRLVIDNLKAAVAKADWYDPEVHPKLQSFAAHYGTVFLPTKPYTPRHKGKAESSVSSSKSGERGAGFERSEPPDPRLSGGSLALDPGHPKADRPNLELLSVKYVKRNGLKGRVFTGLAEENQFLLDWETHVADTRIHGTTKRQVGKLFAESEHDALLPLPVERFPFFYESRRAVHRDGHVEVDKAYYSVPPEYVGRRLWVRWDGRLVRVFSDRWQQVAVHAKAEPGRFRTAAEHIPKEKVSVVERGTDALLRQVATIGPQTRQWAEAMTQARGVEGVRVLVGLSGPRPGVVPPGEKPNQSVQPPQPLVKDRCEGDKQ